MNLVERLLNGNTTQNSNKAVMILAKEIDWRKCCSPICRLNSINAPNWSTFLCFIFLCTNDFALPQNFKSAKPRFNACFLLCAWSLFVGWHVRCNRFCCNRFCCNKFCCNKFCGNRFMTYLLVTRRVSATALLKIMRSKALWITESKIPTQAQYDGLHSSQIWAPWDKQYGIQHRYYWRQSNGGRKHNNERDVWHIEDWWSGK